MNRLGNFFYEAVLWRSCDVGVEPPSWASCQRFIDVSYLLFIFVVHCCVPVVGSQSLARDSLSYYARRHARHNTLAVAARGVLLLAMDKAARVVVVLSVLFLFLSSGLPLLIQSIFLLLVCCCYLCFIGGYWPSLATLTTTSCQALTLITAMTKWKLQSDSMIFFALGFTTLIHWSLL